MEEAEFGAIIGEFTGGGGASSRPVSPTVMLLKIFETKDFFEKYYNDDEFLKNLAAPVKYNKDSQLNMMMKKSIKMANGSLVKNYF